MAFKPTDEQKKAITANGNILVSAAAGSGKTAVLVERVISKLTSKTNPISAHKLLIVTFTNAAAAEMRTRIEKRLDEECKNNPNDISLIMQKHQLSAAKICTIDSFCIDLVRENFDVLGISPDFKMSDGDSLNQINEAVIYKIINRYLEEENPIFLKLLDIVGAEYDAEKFSEFILNIYNYSRQFPFPKKWFLSLAQLYNNGIFDNNSIWWQAAFEEAIHIIENSIDSLNHAIELISIDEKAYNAYYSLFNDALTQFFSLKEAASYNEWDKLYKAIENFSAFNLPIVRGMNGIYEITAAKDIYKYTTIKSIEILKRLFYADNYFINSQFDFLYEPVELLANILIEFDDLVFNEYKLQNTFTFHNTEHMALKLLCDEDNKENNLSYELQNRFDEVLVDEYQDTNDLQDMLFYVLSGGEKRLFVVGDVKQSIYGFRGANPHNFLRKKSRYTPIDFAAENMPKKIILGNNFRCKKESCEFINYFFELFMNEDTGKIIYNQEEMLIPAAVFPETENTSTEFHLISTKGSVEHPTVLEARHIANYIKKTINSGDSIRISDTELRKAEYSDFTILLRSTKTKAHIIAEELKRQGIPVNYSSENFHNSIEVSMFLALLSVIDNPESDIDLLSVMMSPIFSFTPDELAEIRAQKRNGTLYSAVIFAYESGNSKIIKFLNTLKKYRLYGVVNTLPNLISLLLYETGLLDIVSAMNGGQQRKNNLLKLSELAQQYILSTNGTICGFVKYLIKHSESYTKSATISAGVNAVKIMSIHASKGLQFPICIIADTASDFNDNEAREASLYSPNSGIGFKYFDETSKEKQTTISREIILNEYRAIRLEEELRLLYVAMTRTQDKLIFCGTVSDIDKKIDAIKTMLLSSDNRVTNYLFSRTKSYCDWLIISLLLHRCGEKLRGSGSSIIPIDNNSEIKLELISYENIENSPIIKKEDSNSLNTDLIELMKNNLAYKYPFAEICDIEAKASVSMLANSAENSKYAFSYKPDFLISTGITPAGRGTAMHKVMQYFDFSKYDRIEEELERLYEWQFISEIEYDSINTNALSEFFSSNTFKRIINSKRFEREIRFLTEVPVKSVEPTIDEKFNDEKIIIQGAVDVCFIEDDGLVILDFKTDRVDDSKKLLDTYSKQLELYALACEKIFELPVKQKIIYSFALSKEIEV